MWIGWRAKLDNFALRRLQLCSPRPWIARLVTIYQQIPNLSLGHTMKYSKTKCSGSQIQVWKCLSNRFFSEIWSDHLASIVFFATQHFPEGEPANSGQVTQSGQTSGLGSTTGAASLTVRQAPACRTVIGCGTRPADASRRRVSQRNTLRRSIVSAV